MNELKVFNFNQVDVVDSRDVARMVERQHKNLLRDIDGYIKAMKKSAEPRVGPSAELKIEPSDFFIKSSYKDSTGRELPCYLLTKKGCDMVANKMTGEKGVLFTAAYVTAFEKMRETLTSKSVEQLASAIQTQEAIVASVQKLTDLVSAQGNNAQILTDVVEKLSNRVMALEDTATDPFRPAPDLSAHQLLAPGEDEALEPQAPGGAYMKRWMRTASEKLTLLSNKFRMGNNAILSQLYRYLEKDFGVDLAEERIRIIEEYGLGDCSTLKAIFHDAEFRDDFECLVDYNLALENRGW